MMETSANLESYNKSTMCRICMQNDNNTVSIFNEVYFGDKTITIAEIISECTKYPVAHNDQLPEQICHSCIEMAKNAHRFKNQTEEAYLQLKALYDITWLPKQEQGGGSANSMSTLTTHKYTQTEKTSVFLCEICPKKFFVESELRNHRNTSHIHDGKKCRVCGESFIHLGQLKIHLSTEHPSEGIRCDFRCYICLREFTRKDHLKRHLIRVHKLVDMQLNITKVSLDEPEIENPPVLSSTLNDYSSNWPDYRENYDKEPIAIDQKSQTFNATNPFSSEDEGLDQRDFNDIENEDVKQFVKTITTPEISIKEEPNDIIDAYSYDDIDLCEPKTQPDTIIPEENDDDDDEEDDYATNCDYDRQSFLEPAKIIKLEREAATQSINFNNKYQRNSQTNMYHCVECLLEFKLQRNLVRHMLTHTDDRPFSCHICLKTFKRKDNLQKHLRDVHAEKQFPCNICGKKFATNQQLQRHNQTSLHKKYFKI